MSNLIFGDNASFATSIGTWATAQNGANFNPSWSSADQKLRVDVTTGGANIAMAHTGNTTVGKPAVTPGQTITMSAKVKQAAGATMRTVRLEGNFYDGANVALATNSVVTATGSQVTASGTEQTIAGTLTVPAGAAYMRARWTVVTPAAGDAFLWDDVVLDDGKALSGDVLVDRFDGVGMVRHKVDRWSGTAAVRQRLDRPAVTSNTPVSLANAAQTTIGGEVHTAQSPDQPYSLAIVSDPSAPTYQRFELRDGDRWINDINQFPNDARQRAMLRGATFWPFNTDVWFSGSLRVTPDGWRTNYAQAYNELMCFFHNMEGSESGESKKAEVRIAVMVPAGVPRLQVQTAGDPTGAAISTSAQQTIRYDTDFAPFSGQWMNWVIRSRFHYSNGQCQMWLNGTQLFNLSGIPCGYNDSQGPYLKTGLYRTGSPYTTVVEWANVEIGTASKLSRVTSPLPIPAY